MFSRGQEGVDARMGARDDSSGRGRRKLSWFVGVLVLAVVRLEWCIVLGKVEVREGSCSALMLPAVWGTVSVDAAVVGIGAVHDCRRVDWVSRGWRYK